MRTMLIAAGATFLTGVALLEAPTNAAAFEASAVATSNDKLRGGLEDVIRDALPGELIPVIIMLEDELDPAVRGEAARLPKELRREFMVDALKDVAARSQGPVLAQLANEQARGGAGERIDPVWITNAIGADLTADAIRRVAGRLDVAYLWYDPALGDELFPVEPEADPGNLGDDAGNPLSGGIECGVALMRAPQVWSDLNITGRGAVVGVIDTGCCITHPDLRNQIWVNVDEVPGNNIDDDNNGYIDDVNGWSFDQNGSNNNISDSNGHGTHVSGTVAGDGTNGETTGMAPDCAVMTLKFFNNVSGGQLSVWNCTQYGVENGADVLTASLGWRHAWNPDRRRFREVCENAIAAGVVVIYAAGNEGTCCPPYDHVRTPGDVPDVITIGATDCSDRIASFSSRGPVTWQNVNPYNDWPYPPGKIKPSVSAPGVGTRSTSNNCSGYRSLSGTSMATPHVAGTVALMLEANPALDHHQIKQMLMDTAVDLGADGIDNVFGAGRVDAYAAVQAALESVEDSASLVDFNIVAGTRISGGLQRLAESDDRVMTIASEYFHEITQANRIQMIVGFEATGSPSTLNISVEHAADQPGGIGQILIRNWDTGQFELLHQYAFGTEEIVVNVDNVDATDRIRGSDGRIEILLNDTMSLTFKAAGFEMEFDHVGIALD